MKQRQFLPRNHIFIQKKASFISSKLFLIKLYFYIIIHSFYIALFSALKQTQYAHVACDSEWVTVSFYTIACIIIIIHGSGVLVALCGCHMKCCHFGASSVYTIQPCTRLQCHFIQSHIDRVVSCNLPPALLAEWPGSFTCYCSNTGVEQTPKVDPGEENSPAAPAGIWTHDLSITSLALWPLSYPAPRIYASSSAL